eukprot:12264509-Karenia_brevis.AAC.1
MPNYLAKDIRDTLIEDRYCRVIVNDFAFGSIHLPDTSKGIENMEEVLKLVTKDLENMRSKQHVKE